MVATNEQWCPSTDKNQVVHVTPPTTKCEPLLMTELPMRPWETVATDLKGPFPTGEHIRHNRLLLQILEIGILNEITSESII